MIALRVYTATNGARGVLGKIEGVPGDEGRWRCHVVFETDPPADLDPEEVVLATAEIDALPTVSFDLPPVEGAEWTEDRIPLRSECVARGFHMARRSPSGLCAACYCE